LKQKEAKIKKSIRDMTPRQQRLQRKKWNKASKNYYSRKKENEEIKRKELESILKENTPPLSDAEEPQRVPTHSIRYAVGKRVAQRNRMKKYRVNLKKEMLCRQLQKQVNIYKSKYYRLKKSSRTRKVIKIPMKNHQQEKFKLC